MGVEGFSLSSQKVVPNWLNKRRKRRRRRRKKKMFQIRT
jgi:hypothetical protein